MTAITATELQFLGCFGAEPKLLDPDLPWCYNDAVYRAVVGDFAISFAIQPSYRDVRIVVRLEERVIFEFNGVEVADVQIIDQPGLDAVEVSLTDRSRLRLRLRPTMEVTQGFETSATSPS